MCTEAHPSIPSLPAFGTNSEKHMKSLSLKALTSGVHGLVSKKNKIVFKYSFWVGGGVINRCCPVIISSQTALVAV